MNYQLNIKIPFEAMDDVAARQIASRYQVEVSSVIPESEQKLQQVFNDKPPRSVPL